MTLLRLVKCDGDRSADGRAPSDNDCVTRAISNGTGLPYPGVHEMVNEAASLLGQKVDDAAETGADPGMADKILVHDRGWERIQLSGEVLLTVDGLERHLPRPLSAYPVLVIQTERLTRGEVRPENRPLGHLTAVINGDVHDIETLEEATAPSYARSDPMKVIYVPPVGEAAHVAARHAERHPPQASGLQFGRRGVVLLDAALCFEQTAIYVCCDDGVIALDITSDIPDTLRSAIRLHRWREPVKPREIIVLL